MIQVTLSDGKIVTLRDLTARQMMHADLAAQSAGFIGMPSPYYRIAAAVAKIHDPKLPKANRDREFDAQTDLDLEVVIDKFSANDHNQLLTVWNEHFTGGNVRLVDGEVKLTSGKTVRLCENLTARQQLNADRCAQLRPNVLSYYRIAAVMEAFQDAGEAEMKARPAVDQSNPAKELDARIDLLSARDFSELLGVYAESSMPTKADIKNV